MKDLLIIQIVSLLEQSNDVGLLDLIFQLLDKAVKRGA